MLRVLLVALCIAASAPAARPAADPSLDPAAAAAAAGRFDEALQLFAAALDAGYPRPGDVYTDPRFANLRDDRDSRGALRTLLARHVRQSDVTMVGPAEAGVPMEIRGTVVATSGQPVPGATVHLYHTDATGNYEPGRRTGDGSNPRLSCYVRTDDAGKFTVRTIRPEPYPGSSPGGAHVHYRIEAAGYRSYGDEFRPYTNPADGTRQTGRPYSVATERNGGLLLEVTLPLVAAD